MPNFKEHCKISKERTGGTFEELHKWMDEGQEYLKHDHRLERHFYTEEYRKFIEEKWGDKAVVEWLFHIAIDNMETANKFAIKSYHHGYDQIDVIFTDKEVSGIDFWKNFPNSSKKSSYKKY